MKKSICLLMAITASAGLRAGIAIDGNFADWSTIPQNILAESSTDAKAEYKALYSMKFCMDAEYIYFYLEFSGETAEYIDDNDNKQIGDTIHAFDIALSTDNDPTTGFNFAFWENSASDYLIEAVDYDFENAGLYNFASEDQGAFDWEESGISGFISTCNPVALANKNKALEGKILIPMLPAKIKTLKVGVFVSGHNWEQIGNLPQTTLNSDNAETLLPLLEVPANTTSLAEIPEPEEPTVTVLGKEIPTDTTGVIDIYGDSTMIYDTDENTLTINNLTLEVGEEESTAISYSGSEPLTIVLSDSSTIVADTVISSTADIIITGEGHLVAEGVTPIIGAPTASITFEAVNMHVRSLPSSAAVRRRIKGGKRLDETGGPALSGFGSADFNKTNVSPSDAEYGAITTTDGNGNQTTINALYTTDENGEQEVVTEFELTADLTAIESIRASQPFDPSQPMYNILGVPVDATYKGLVIQNGQKHFIQ